MATNIQPQTQQSGGDELEQFANSIGWKLGKTTTNYVRSGYVMGMPGFGMMSAEAMADLRARERAARIDESIYTSQHIPEFYNLQEKYQWFEERQQQLQPKPQAGEGGEV